MNIRDQNQDEMLLVEENKIMYKTIYTILNKYKVRRIINNLYFHKFG